MKCTILANETKVHNGESKMKNAKNTFEAGKTYWTRSVCDSECIITITVAKRTAKFLTTTEGKRLGISIWDGVEHVKPWGAYSMAPIIPADRMVVGDRLRSKATALKSKPRGYFLQSQF